MAPHSRHPAPASGKARQNRRVRGALIAFEGLDGSGKSTQIELLHKWLEHAGFGILLTKANESALVGPVIRRARKERLLRPATACLLQAADLAERLYQDILPALDDGRLVLMDRYIYTAMARGVARGQGRDWLAALYHLAPPPDLCFYLRLPVESALERILSRRQPRYHESGMDLRLSDDPVESFRLFQGRIAAEYEALVQDHDMEVIDATQPIQKQQDKLRRSVRAIIHTKMGGHIGLKDRVHANPS
jgi:dTMP kinase